MSGNRSDHVISSDKISRDEKSSEYVHPFGGSNNAQCPLCKAMFSDCKVMYQHLARRHPLTASSSYLPGRSFPIPSFKKSPGLKKTEVVCIVCRRGMQEDDYTKHILWSHPWILDEATREVWEKAREKLIVSRADNGEGDLPATFVFSEDDECSSIGAMMAVKGIRITNKEVHVEVAVEGVADERRPLTASGAGLASSHLPEVPSPPNLASLLEYLDNLGIDYDNKRPLGGGIWVFRGKEFEPLAKHLGASGVSVRFFPEGRKNRTGEQWEIDPGKRLGQK